MMEPKQEWSLVLKQSVCVKESDTCGRKLVATRTFAPGQCILEELPYAYVLKYQRRELFCSFCLKQCSTLEKCPSCEYVAYCSTYCEKNDRARCHDQDCEALKSKGPETNQDKPLLLSQIIRKQRNTVPSPRGDDCFPTAVDQLISHHEKLGSSDMTKKYFKEMLKQFIEEDVIADIKLISLLQMYFATQVNLLPIFDYDLNDFANGIYLRASMANHSCDPNCAVVFDGRKLQVRTIKDVEKGKECTISYLIEHFNYPTKERLALIEQLLKFTCKCVKCCCIENINALEPNEVAEVERLKESKEGVDVEIMDASKSRDLTKVLQKLEPYLKSTASSCLPAVHHLLVEVREIAFEIYMKMKLWDNAAQMGQLIVQPYRDYYGPNHPKLGIHLLRMGQVLHQRGKLQEARKYLTEAESVLEVTHGPQHSLMASVKKLLFKCR